eukprot:ANDGO_07477.mRNA.1 putative oxidoreductase At4g09670
MSLDSQASLVWGVLSTANIAKRSIEAIRAAGSSVLAIASRDATKAASFASEFGIPVSYGSYELLLEDPRIQAVYVPLPCSMHKKWVLEAAVRRKHVLVEKPAAVNALEVAEMTECCKANNVLYMDGVHYMHSLRTARILEIVQGSRAYSGQFSLGDLRHLDIVFSFLGDSNFMQTNIRTHRDLEPLGVLGDLGVYSIRYMVVLLAQVYAKSGLPAAAFNPTEHCKCSFSRIHKESLEGVPTEMSVCFEWDCGVTSNMFLSFHAAPAQRAFLVGTAGTVTVDDFSSAKIAMGSQFRVSSVVSGDVVESVESVIEPQNVRMFSRFAQLAEYPLSAEAGYWRNISVWTQALMDTCLARAVRSAQT